jgi:hypothetical protein
MIVSVGLDIFLVWAIDFFGGGVGGFMLHSTADEHTTTDCTVWDAWETWTPTIKQNFMTFAMSNMDALQVSISTPFLL